MDFEQAIETQRLRLLRFLAGLAVAVGFLSVGPVSRGFSVWACDYISSILSRAELAARCLVIAQARMIAKSNDACDFTRFSDAFDAPEAGQSPSDCRARFKVLRAVLMDLPRHARGLLRRIEKQSRRALCMDRTTPCPEMRRSASLRTWRLAGPRIERPPDIERRASPRVSAPSGFRAGGAARWRTRKCSEQIQGHSDSFGLHNTIAFYPACRIRRGAA